VSQQSDPDRDRQHRQFLEDVLDGLLEKPQKTLPSKYFYDARGLSLFKEISSTPEYYLTRSELAIMERSSPEIAATIGSGCLLIEYGSGAADKAGVLLQSLEDPAGYISIDISREHLDEAVEILTRAFPEVEILGLCTDFTAPFELPAISRAPRRRVIYFAGSTIGNFEPVDAASLLRGMRAHLEESDGLLIGIDLKKDIAVLERAYDDAERRTEAFNRNLLVRINRELGADFDPERFEHRAVYVTSRDRIEMHLVSLDDQVVRIGDTDIHFRDGESIHTESAHKYEIEEFSGWASELGFRLKRSWTDDDRNFGVLYLTLEIPEGIPSISARRRIPASKGG